MKIISRIILPLILLTLNGIWVNVTIMDIINHPSIFIRLHEDARFIVLVKSLIVPGLCIASLVNALWDLSYINKLDK